MPFRKKHGFSSKNQVIKIAFEDTNHMRITWLLTKKNTFITKNEYTLTKNFTFVPN